MIIGSWREMWEKPEPRKVNRPSIEGDPRDRVCMHAKHRIIVGKAQADVAKPQSFKSKACEKARNGSEEWVL